MVPSSSNGACGVVVVVQVTESLMLELAHCGHYRRTCRKEQSARRQLLAVTAIRMRRRRRYLVNMNCRYDGSKFRTTLDIATIRQVVAYSARIYFLALSERNCLLGGNKLDTSSLI